MKKFYISFLLLILSVGAHAQSGAFYQEVTWGMRHIASAQSLQQIDKAVSIFKDLSTRNQGSYLPDYYVALSLLFKADYLAELSDRDAAVDGAMEYIARAEKLSPNNPELEFLRGYALTTRMLGDPAYRADLYAPQIIGHFEKVMEMEPSNPRPPTLMAFLMMNLPDYFYSDEHSPCGLAQQAIQLYPGYHKDHLLVWGRELAERILQDCN